MPPLTATRTNAQGLACHVADDLIERIAAGHPLTDGGCLLGKGALMSVSGRVYKRCGCLNPDTRRR